MAAKIDRAITEAPKAVRSCPECAGKAYSVRTALRDDTLTADQIICDACGFDILQHYRAQQRRLLPVLKTFFTRFGFG